MIFFFVLSPVTSHGSITYCQLESKQSSKQWKRPDYALPTKIKQEKSEHEVLYSFF